MSARKEIARYYSTLIALRKRSVRSTSCRLHVITIIHSIIAGVKTHYYRISGRRASNYSRSNGFFRVVWGFQEKLGHPPCRGRHACLGIELRQQAGHLLLFVVFLLALQLFQGLRRTTNINQKSDRSNEEKAQEKKVNH